MAAARCMASSSHPPPLRGLAQTLPVRSRPTKCRISWAGRAFSSSCVQCDHYKTLGVPKGATKAQIKSHFYQVGTYRSLKGFRDSFVSLSKKHHPDVSKDAKSPEIYTRVTEAYKVLSDDRERRIYDRSGSTHPAHHPRSQYQPGPDGNGYRPRPGATYAWERPSRRPSASSASSTSSSYGNASEFSRRPGDWSRPFQQQNPHTHPGSQARQHPGQGAHYDPSEYVYRYTGRTPRQKASDEEKALERVQRVSGLRRAFQVVALLVLSAGFVGGWR
ncbi:hypothetical protein DXG03_007577 [Asterophora parasitica]|uniref:J domain-containing protein n=1 Tax=Asterophora parasitica TaxID=117018 RepID=A0A9P7GD77_9AGAR|nr:hypothetical protein DXG03_007577 [Asterophora parasitica]